MSGSKPSIFCLLTLLLATVAGLITHFDALAHAAGLPVTDQGVSGIIPLWVMTALRAIAVIGFLLASRIKEVSFTALGTAAASKTDRSTSAPEAVPSVSASVPPPLDYQALATAMLTAMQQADVLPRVRIREEPTPSVTHALPAPQAVCAAQETPAEQTETTGASGTPNRPEPISLPLLPDGNSSHLSPESEGMGRRQEQSETASLESCLYEQDPGNQDQMPQEPDETMHNETVSNEDQSTRETAGSDSGDEGDPDGNQTRSTCLMSGEYSRREHLPADREARASGLIPTQQETPSEDQCYGPWSR